MSNTGSLVGGVVGLAIGVAVADRILHNRKKRGKKRYIRPLDWRID